MPTTIQVSEETLKRLREAKEEAGADSYDEIIRRLLKKTSSGKSRFGAHPDMKPFQHGRTAHGD